MRRAQKADQPSGGHSPILFEALIQSLPLPAAILDHEGRIVRVNAAWEAVESGKMKPRDNFLEYLARFKTVNPAPAPDEQLRDLFSGKRESVDVIYQTRPFNSRSFRLRASRLQESGEHVALLLHEDVTKFVESDTEARTSGDWLRLALEAGQLGAWEWNRRIGRIVWTSPTNAIFHQPDGEFDGLYSSFLKLVHPDDRRRLRIEVVRCRRERCLFQHEYRLADTSCGEIWVRVSGRFLFNPGGRALHMLGVIQEITAQRKHAKLDAERERKHALATLTAAVAHEFNGLLMAAAAFLDSAVHQNEASIGPNLRQARDAITRSQSMAAALLDAYMGGEEGRRSLQLTRYLPQALGRLQVELGAAVRLEHRIEAPKPRAAVPGSVLEHALRILINNAADAGATRIQVIVSPGARQVGALQLIYLVVEDDGGGIETTLQQRIFQRYFSTRATRARAGLGLALADELLRGAGGSLELLESQAGRTRFRITLLSGKESYE